MSDGAKPVAARGAAVSLQPRWRRAISGTTSLTTLALAIGLPAVAFALVSVFGSASSEREVTLMLIYVTVVVGLYVFSGLSGVMTFGHMGFMAIGAYAGAILTIPPLRKEFLLPDLPSFLQQAELGAFDGALVAGAIAAVVAGVASIPIMRLSGIGASLATLALLVIVYIVAQNWEAVTRGNQTMLGVPTNTTLTSAFLMSVAVVTIAYLFERSTPGLRLRAHREEELAAQASGIVGSTERRLAFIVSAFIVGMAGFAFAQFVGAFNADAFYLDLTFLTLAMLVVGGIYSLPGAVLGAMTVTGLSWALRSFEHDQDLGLFVLPGLSGVRELGVALAMLVVLLLYREGLAGAGESLVRGGAALTAAIRRRRAPVGDGPGS
jgi:branched-chain amino acid transport system permease protein